MADTSERQLTPSWHARHTPDKPAIVFGPTGEVTTYAELDERSTRLAHALRARGLTEGSHVAVLMENNRQFLEVLWGAQRSALCYTTINRHLRAAEVQYVLDDSGATALVTSEAMRDVIADLDLSRIPVRIVVDRALPGFELYDEVLAAAPDGPFPNEREGREML